MARRSRAGRLILTSGKKDRIPLDALKMAALTINMAAAIATCAHDGRDLSDHPVLCNACDGLSASDWLNFKCKTSLIGRTVGRFFIGLLMGTSLGIQAQGDPSLVQLELDRMGAGSFHRLHAPDYLTNCPHLKPCRLFQLSSTLRGTILEILLMSVWKDPLTVRKLQPQTHSSIIFSTL